MRAGFLMNIKTHFGKLPLEMMHFQPLKNKYLNQYYVLLLMQLRYGLKNITIIKICTYKCIIQEVYSRFEKKTDYYPYQCQAKKEKNANALGTIQILRKQNSGWVGLAK